MNFIYTVRILFLILLWAACSQSMELFFIVSGASTILLAAWVMLRFDLCESVTLWQKPHALMVYLVWLFKEMAIAAAQVTRTIWQVKPQICPRLFSVDSSLKTDLARSIYGNSITLTAGTICVALNSKQFSVHSLQKASMKDLLEHRMEHQVAKAL